MFLFEKFPKWFIQWRIFVYLIQIRKRSIYKRQRRAQEAAAAAAAQSHPTSTAQ